MVNNLKSVANFPQVVRDKVWKEIAEGRVEGPFRDHPFRNFRLSPLGVVPKKEHNSFRLIHHLSFPKGQSLNDDIDMSLCSFSYASFEDAIAKIRLCGTEALMAKADIKSAFHLLPISPAAFNSLGFHFDDCFFFDKCLPMGCSLSCAYFEAFSTFLHWSVCLQPGVDSVVHYLDDFLFVGPASDTRCAVLLCNFQLMTKSFGVPLAEEKM